MSWHSPKSIEISHLEHLLRNTVQSIIKCLVHYANEVHYQHYQEVPTHWNWSPLIKQALMAMFWWRLIMPLLKLSATSIRFKTSLSELEEVLRYHYDRKKKKIKNQNNSTVEIVQSSGPKATLIKESNKYLYNKRMRFPSCLATNSFQVYNGTQPDSVTSWCNEIHLNSNADLLFMILQ